MTFDDAVSVNTGAPSPPGQAGSRCAEQGSGAGQRDGEPGQDMDELGGHRARRQDRRAGGDGTAGCRRRVRNGRRGQAGQGAPPGGDTLAGEHAEPERERGSAGVQRGMTQLLVAGVQPAAGSTSLAGLRAGARFSSRGAR